MFNSFYVGYNFDVLKGTAWYDVWVASDSVSFTLVDLGENFPVASVDVFDTVVGVNFDAESMYLIS